MLLLRLALPTFNDRWPAEEFKLLPQHNGHLLPRAPLMPWWNRSRSYDRSSLRDEAVNPAHRVPGAAPKPMRRAIAASLMRGRCEKTEDTRQRVKAHRERKRQQNQPPRNALAVDEIPTEAEAEESYQETLFDQACLLLGSMADATRQRFFAYLERKYHAR